LKLYIYIKQNKSFELTNQTPKAQTAENKRVKHVLPQFRKGEMFKVL